jgi:hypothetical protein
VAEVKEESQTRELPHSMANLPLELTDRVIDFLHSDKNALAACSLVCKSWVPASRYHFFGEITFTTVAKVQSFIELFESTIAKVDENERLSNVTNEVPNGIGFFNYVRKLS